MPAVSRLLDALIRTRYELDKEPDTNNAGLGIIMLCEAFVPHWYVCPAGVWTVGFGTTEGLFPGVTRRGLPGPIDEEHARHLLIRALAEIFEPAIERYVTVPLTANQFSALASFVYNVGAERFRTSTLLKRVNQQRWLHAADQFPRWVYADGRVMPGLVKRRQAERDLFLSKPNWGEIVELANLEPMKPMLIEPLPFTPPPRLPRPLPIR